METINTYINSLRGKSISVIGMGVSNTPLIELLLTSGLDVTVRDRSDKHEDTDAANMLIKMGGRLILGPDYLDNIKEQVIFRTPGLHPHTPSLRQAAERGSTVTSEMELFFALCPSRIIAVTGSDGKTTTTSVIAQLLKASGYKVHVGGNIGRPLLRDLPEIEEEDWTVLELSSFQLHSMTCRPNIAVITNISPNHLDVHPDMADYIDAKKKIFVNQTENDILVLNLRDPLSEVFAGEAGASVRYFSRAQEVKQGAFENDAVIYIAKDGKCRELMKTSDIRIPGAHNVENYLAAFAAVLELAPDGVCRKVAESFPGVAHRLEYIRTLDGAEYYNDSIASSPTRTIAGLRSFKKKPILIAGGYDKNIPFGELAEEINTRVKRLYLTGDTADKICSAVVNAKNRDKTLEIIVEGDFERAVKMAAGSAREGDVVLLSPACASFDKFHNFEQRGDFFKHIVMKLESRFMERSV